MSVVLSNLSRTGETLLRMVNHVAWVCLLTFAVMPIRNAAGLEVSIVNAFPTEPITSFSVVSVSNDVDSLLLGVSDGSVVRVGKDGAYLSEVLPAGLIGGVYPPAGKGLAAASSIDRIYAVPDGVFVYNTSGTLIGPLLIFGGGASYVGVSFSPRPSGGILSLLWEKLGIIVSTEVDIDGKITVPVDRVLLPEGLAGTGLSGIASIADSNLFVVSRKNAKLLLIGRGSQVHEEQWTSRLIAETDLAPLGITTIEDVSFDQATHHLFVVSPEERQVFELTMTPTTVFHRGDPDEDARVDLADAVHILKFLFQGDLAPSCLDASDANNDGRIDVSDAVYLLSFLFRGGPAPPLPGPPDVPCGIEPDLADSLSGLGCKAYAGCLK